MAIPSYDDLTPSIPDVTPGDMFSLTAVLPRPGSKDPGPTNRDVAPGSLDPGDNHDLYAALHEAEGAAIDRLMAIAREFSPRIERRPGGTVVLDVSGLQRLLGDPRSIAEHLARA